MDTSISATDRETIYVSSDDRSVISRVRKLKAADPDRIVIIREPENNDGCIYCRMPYEYLHLNKKRTVNMTDEQKKISADRLRSLRNDRISHVDSTN